MVARTEADAELPGVLLDGQLLAALRIPEPGLDKRPGDGLASPKVDVAWDLIPFHAGESGRSRGRLARRGVADHFPKVARCALRHRSRRLSWGPQDDELKRIPAQEGLALLRGQTSDNYADSVLTTALMKEVKLIKLAKRGVEESR